MNFDGIVIGGGAAGMMAAITAAQAGAKVILLEKNNRLGKKLLITGKGRCNVTNHCSAAEVLQNVPRNGRFLYSCMNAFPPERAIAFFEESGCTLKTERGNRVFPTTDRSSSVLEALQSRIRRAGISIRTCTAQEILIDHARVSGVRTSTGSIGADWVVLATGGLSYPATGSTGDGYRMAKSLGHTVTPCDGSLVPLEAADTDCQEMHGLSLRNIAVKLVDTKGKVLYRDFGELVFTDFGISGPTVLSASAHVNGRCIFYIDLKPALDEGQLDNRILRDLAQYCNRPMEYALTDLLPRAMIPVVLRRLGVAPELPANSFSKGNRLALVKLLKNFCVTISGKRPVSEAIITSGGVRVSEVDPKTMQSKIVPGLYFAGEILDCDAYTGGFNLQIAWATAYAAGNAAARNACVHDSCLDKMRCV